MDPATAPQEVLCLRRLHPLRLPEADLVFRAAALCLYQLSLSIFLPVLAPEASRLGASLTTVGIVLAAYGLAQFVCRIPAGLWSDRLGRRRPLIVGGLALCAIATLGMGWAPSSGWLALFRAVSGVGACAWVFLTLTMAEFFPPHQAGRALGLANGLATAAVLVGMLIGGLAAQWGGYRAAFVCAAICAACGMAAAAAIREGPALPRARAGADLRALVRTPALVIGSGIAILGQYVAYVTVYGFDPLLAQQRFGAPGAALGLLSVAAALPWAVTALASGPLLERFGARAAVGAGLVVAAAGTALAGLAPNLALLDLSVVGVGAGLGLGLSALMTASVLEVPPERRGGAMGFYQAFYACGNCAGPAVAGVVGSRFGLVWLFESTAALGLVGAVLGALVLVAARRAA